MKILIATPVYPPEIGGPATYTKEIVEMMKDKHDIRIVAYADNAKQISGVPLTTVSKKLPLIKRLRAFHKALKSAAKDVDVIYVQNAMAAGLPAVHVGKILKKPVVLKFVGDESWERAKQYGQTTKRLDEFLEKPEGSKRIMLMHKVQGWVLRNAGLIAITTPSEYLKSILVKAYGIDPNKCIVNYNAALQKEDYPEDPFPPQKKKHQLVATARLTPWKGIDGIIQAVHILKNDIPDIHLVVAGDGPEEENLKQLIKELDVENHVTLLGRISRTETRQLRKESGIYILNSTYEGLPHTVLTSFSAEIPVIATDIGGTNEVVYHNETGLLVKPNNPQALSKAIRQLLNDEPLQKRLTKNGENLLREKFSWQAHISNLEKILSKAIDEQKN